MIKKMVMDEDRLREVLGFSRIGLPEEEFAEVLDRVNSVLRMCDEMQELDHDNVEPFEWDIKKAPARREDVPVVWGGRMIFLTPLRSETAIFSVCRESLPRTTILPKMNLGRNK